MRKLAVVFLMICLMCASVLADLNFINEQPLDGSTIPGSASTLFSVDVNETCTTGNLFFVNPPAVYGMSCIGNTASVTIDLSLIADNSWYDWYPIINSFIGPIYSFYVDKIPSIPTGFAGIATESDITLSWNANPESDIFYYSLYKDGSFWVNLSTTTQVDSAVILGNIYTYEVSATDNAFQEGPRSAPVSVLVKDQTPPGEPVVTPSSGVCDGVTRVCDIPALNPTFSIDYSGTESSNVNLTVQTGANILERFYDDTVFSWPYLFPASGTYFITFNATDAYGNYDEVTYTMNMALGSTDLPIELLDMNHISINAYGVKTSANINGGDCIVLGYDISAYYDGTSPLYLRSLMPDIIGAGGTIQVTEETTPTMYCGENYDPTNPCSVTGTTYSPDNAYDMGQPAITCTDQTVGGSEDYMVYVNIPIPAGEVSGPYTVGTTFGLYTIP